MPTATDASHMDMADALAALGVDDAMPSDAQRSSLDRDGFLLCADFIPDARLAAMREAYEAISAREGSRVGTDHHQETGARRIGDLVNKGEVWDWAYGHPLLLACARHVIGGPFRLCGYSARDPQRGGGHQGYHRDMPWLDGRRGSLSVCLLLDDFRADSGPIRLLPGSHVVAETPAADPHPDELRIEAPAGSVLIFDAHLHHAGSTNLSGALRRMVHVQYVARDLEFWLAHQRETIRLATWRRLSPALRWVLAV
ncbi:MAG: phytanoyl-CoA dioxygenase family protein [Planctomycetes bacterium]|nr:phytanoyl-CoA dioxygenase family protein [Planctomycetota bacterium]